MFSFSVSADLHLIYLQNHHLKGHHDAQKKQGKFSNEYFVTIFKKFDRLDFHPQT